MHSDEEKDCTTCAKKPAQAASDNFADMESRSTTTKPPKNGSEKGTTALMTSFLLCSGDATTTVHVPAGRMSSRAHVLDFCGFELPIRRGRLHSGDGAAHAHIRCQIMYDWYCQTGHEYMFKPQPGTRYRTGKFQQLYYRTVCKAEETMQQSS
jgi:hypothetical protein